MPKAKYDDLYKTIKHRIECCKYSYQSLIPSENTFVAEFSCSRNTVRRALAVLAEEGYVQPIHGKGVRVIYQPVSKTSFTLGGIESFQETAHRNHLHAVTKVTCFEEVITTERLAAASGFAPGTALWHVERIRYLDGKALILDENYFDKNMVPGLTPSIVERSIYEYLENTLHVQIVTSKRTITVEHATETARKYLDLNGYDCLAVVTSQTFNNDGVMFEYTRSHHQPEYFAFQDTATRRK